VDEAYSDAMRAMGPSILQSMPKGDGTDPALRQKVLEAVNEAASDLMGVLVQRWSPSWRRSIRRRNFSDLVTFYESKSGRAMIEKQPLMAAKLAPLMKDIMPKFRPT